MMHFNQLPLEKLDEIKPQSRKLQQKLDGLNLYVRDYAGSHYNFYLIASLLHWELCLLDDNHIQGWINEFPDLVRFANLYARGNGLRMIDITPDDPGV